MGPPQWLDVSELSFETLLLLERVQLSWLPKPGWLPARELAVALHANPVVARWMRQKCPEIAGWVDGVLARFPVADDVEDVRRAEIAVLSTVNDLLTYVVDPAVYDAQAFHGWDSRELTGLVEFAGKTVIDVGTGTGRLAFAVADVAQAVFAVEPVERLRRYTREKARERGLQNVHVVDGLLTDLPFPDGFADVVMAGHVFGDAPAVEFGELVRVARPGGSVILCPGNLDRDDARHRFLVEQACAWSRFEEPEDGMRRKYWLEVAR
jgi:SAM-dependent methyltransferase